MVDAFWVLTVRYLTRAITKRRWPPRCQASWRYVSVLQSRTSRGRKDDMFVEDVLEASTGHRPSGRADEELRYGCAATDSHPCPEVAGCFLPEWKTSLLPALSEHGYAYNRLESDVGERQANKLRHSQRAGEADVEHRPIADAES